NEKKRHVYTTEAMEYCLWAATTFADELQPSERTLLRSCILSLWHYCASLHPQLCHFVAGLASTEGKFLNTFLSPVIRSLCSSLDVKRGGRVPGLNFLMNVAVFASQKANNVAVENILCIARVYIEGEEATLDEVNCAIAPTLCFLDDMNISIRHQAVDLLDAAVNSFAKQTNKQLPCLFEVCLFAAQHKADISIGSANTLSWCLASAMSLSKQKAQLQEAIMSSCVTAACSQTGFSGVSRNECLATVGYFTAANLLTAAELAGEEFFPLAKRWEHAGSPILKHMQSHLLELEAIPTALESLVFPTMRMLNGLKVINSTVNVWPDAISFANGRHESDSPSKCDGDRFLTPYAADMEVAILSILKIDAKSKLARMLRVYLAVEIIGSESWKSHVFACLSSSVREKIAIGTLSGTIDDFDGFHQGIFLNLPLSTSEVVEMIKSSDRSQQEISYLSEYSVVNNERLNRGSADTSLISVLFGNLEASLSRGENAASTENIYSCEASLSAVLHLLEASTTQLGTETAEAEAETWVNLLLHVLDRNSGLKDSFRSLRVHKICIALLDSLCSLFPSVAVEQLIPAMNATILESIGSNAASFLVDCLVMIVPQFLKHAASVEMSPLDLFQAFVLQCMRIADGKQRIALYQGFLKALSRMSMVGLNDPLPGVFVSLCVAIELHFEKKGTSPAISAPLDDLASMILNDSHITMKTSSTIVMLAYCKDITRRLIDGKERNHEEAAVKAEDLILLSMNGTTATCASDELIADPKSLVVCNLLLQSVCKNTQTTSFQLFLNGLNSCDSKELLPFWQDLILVQTACRNGLVDSKLGRSKTFWETSRRTTDVILGNLNSLLPVHIFLAFATSAIENGETEELRSIAVRSIADRAILFNPHDAEATLFCESLPFLMEMLGCDSTSVFQQSLLVTIETVARKLGCDLDKKPFSKLFVTVVNKSALLIESELSCAASNFERITPLSRETICIASLCASTCIRICGPHALKTLSTLIKAHTETLCVSNEFLSGEDVQQEMKKEAKLMQVSAMHSIVAVVETLPQFMAPYLKDIFAPLALPSKALRDQDASTAIVYKLNATLVSHVPTRLLIPAVLEATNSNHFDVSSLLVMVSLLTSAISRSSRQDVTCHATGLLRTVTSTLDYPVHSRMQSQVLYAARDLFLGFVLKLSEFELRSLYLKLREWKCEVDFTNLDRSARRRAAFWNLSAELSTHLRTIYLPCLSLVFADLINELVSLFGLLTV
ncbi:MAG: hypothetical protein SGBAC_009281, partial [Bacillariaceae sp.]